MSPPSSSGQGAVPQTSSKPQVAHARTRTSSNAASLSKRGSGTPLVEQKVHYTVLIRLPFARRDFVDPAQVDWDQTKDQALWKIISRPKEGARDDIDWQDLASRFGCSSAFLLQQAAWLYERHLNHVRAQMRKVGSGASGGGSASGTGTAPGSVPMKRGGSGGGNAAPRTTSALSMRSRDSPVPPVARISTGVPSTGGQLSRTPSTTTITQSRGPPTPASPRQPVRSSFRSSFPPPRRASPTLETTAEASRPHSRTLSPTSPILSESESESSSSDDDNDNPIRRSQLFKRPPRFMTRQNKPTLARLDDIDVEYDDAAGYGARPDEEDEEEEDGGFLPFAHTSRRKKNQNQQYQLSSAAKEQQLEPARTRHHHDRKGNPSTQTTEADARRGGRPLSEVAAGKQPMRLDSSATSASTNDPRTDDEAVKLSRPGTGTTTGNGSRSGSGSNHRLQRRSTQPSPFSPPESRASHRHGTGALSPGSGHHRTELARLGSPRVGSASGSKRGGEGGGSEGAPSMGSSFSDLDDASVTQSALEEQLLSHMQHAGGLSKMSTISQALRSRYL
ncbi:uncharacterized protein J3D65DRAFT_370564 [Phyllosticta citribraziliensis]|uniref:Autophagy-related protein 29 n=1 Tax=Phyllosticta citribraziliensis TaxID=989973 RepID=A0ABR1LR78_9PEZI